MNASFKSAIERLPNLLFVTSHAAIAKFEKEQGPTFGADLERILGKRLHYIPAGATDVLEAVEGLRAVLQEDDDLIDGVVILGDYATVPSRVMKCLDRELLEELEKLEPESEASNERGTEGTSNAGGDFDDWWTWNDDIYGNRDNGEFLPELPVSRLPIIPAKVGAPFVRGQQAEAYGLRASEFDFADMVFELIDAGQPMKQSPPVSQNGPKSRVEGVETVEGVAWELVDNEQLASSRVFLVLHGMNAAQIQLLGTSMIDDDWTWTPNAINRTHFEGWEQEGGVIFGSICWGALVTDPMARLASLKGDAADLAARTKLNSIPLRYIDMGANAFVGFTTFHNIPCKSVVGELDDLILGAPLHRYFWENIAMHDMAPAEALFRAKATFVESLRPEETDPLALAVELKTIWSATCIGLGW